MNRELFTDANKILTTVEKLSNKHLYFREDLEIIINAAQKRNKFSSLEKLSFNAKFLNGLLKVIQRKEKLVEETFVLKASNEYKDSLQKVMMLLNDLLKDESDFIKSIFNEKFLQFNQQCLSNLNNLCSDLSYLKLYFNDLKEAENSENKKGLEA